MLLKLAPSNFGARLEDHAMGEVVSRRQGLNLSLKPPREVVSPEDLVLVGEFSNRTKAKEFRNFFCAKARRATPTEVQLAAHRQASPPQSPKEGSGFAMLASR
mmetsp:Transcript_24726/g.72428  ORF Transcript_24726/g.72428 Transcript_24726/m.72428 type:complete len:103 (-) Transcript_24726:159-467(-)